MPHNTQNNHRADKANKRKINQARKLVDRFQQQVRFLENSSQHYQQNPSLAENLKTANITIIQSELEALRELLEKISKKINSKLILKL